MNDNLLRLPARRCTWSAKKELNSAEMDTLTKSCSFTTVIKDNGEVQYAWRGPQCTSKNWILENTPCSIVVWQALRWKRIYLMSGSTVKKTTSHQKTGCGYSAIRRTSFRSWFQGLSSSSSSSSHPFNLNNTFKTWNNRPTSFLKFVYFINYNCIKTTVRFE